MRYFLDTEFIEISSIYPIELISIGIISEDEETSYYAINKHFNRERCNSWLRQNVLPYLGDGKELSTNEIAEDIKNMITAAEHPEFWGYYADYDWVVFCQLFGTMLIYLVIFQCIVMTLNN